ncbi:MAG: hypothetical protein QNJ72_16770 [Pleurocapsa sp. MO_226.B13]|nr:hypothetical protein [Pleurocapsa sp. MO_226.B13]
MEKLLMDCLKINTEIERLNLQWQEYDFGDTLYAKVPIILLSKQSNIVTNCKTETYRIQFCQDGYALIFTETNRESEIKKILSKILTIISSLLKRNYSSFKYRKRLSDR